MTGCKRKFDPTDNETLLAVVDNWRLVMTNFNDDNYSYLVHGNSGEIYTPKCSCGEKAPEFLFNLLKLLDEDIQRPVEYVKLKGEVR